MNSWREFKIPQVNDASFRMEKKILWSCIRNSGEEGVTASLIGSSDLLLDAPDDQLRCPTDGSRVEDEYTLGNDGLLTDVAFFDFPFNLWNPTLLPTIVFRFFINWFLADQRIEQESAADGIEENDQK